MLYSNSRKLYLSGWLQKNSPDEYKRGLKLQFFLFFYEVFSFVEEGMADFSDLQGYQNGPAFSTVLRDYTKDRYLFDNEIEITLQNHENEINLNRAKKSAMIVRTASETELSALTHKLNIWNSQKGRIDAGEKQVNLNVKDFSEEDKKLILLLDGMYTPESYDNNRVITINQKYFILNNTDYGRMQPWDWDTLYMLSLSNNDLMNPVYVSINSEGVIEVG